MAKPSSGLATIDFVDSSSRLRGEDLEIVLAVTEGVAENAALVLSKDGTSISAPIAVTASDAASRVVARVPRSAATDGTWSLSFVIDDVHDRVVDARLLVQGRRPTVLLLGATTPRSLTPTRTPAGEDAPGAKQKVARAGGRVLDRALGVLDPDRAARVRSRVRTAARRVLR